MAQNNQNGANMVQTNHLYRFHSGGAPDWPPCDLHRTWGKRGGYFHQYLIPQMIILCHKRDKKSGIFPVFFAFMGKKSDKSPPKNKRSQKCNLKKSFHIKSKD